MATILNEGLSRTLGIEYEFKLKLQTLLTEFKDDPLVRYADGVSGTETAQYPLATAALTKFIKCGPSMGFEAKRNAYAVLEQVVGALKAASQVPSADDTALTNELVNVTKFVGLEGEEDFHFMVATFNLCELISGVVGEVETEVVEGVAPTGGITTVVLLDGGSGYTMDGVDEDEAAYKVLLVGTEDTGNGTGGKATVVLAGGIITGITSVDVAGTGYSVGDILTLEVDTSASGQGSGDLDTQALVEVTAVS
jgi:hypothetical protein